MLPTHWNIWFFIQCNAFAHDEFTFFRLRGHLWPRLYFQITFMCEKHDFGIYCRFRIRSWNLNPLTTCQDIAIFPSQVQRNHYISKNLIYRFIMSEVLISFCRRIRIRLTEYLSREYGNLQWPLNSYKSQWNTFYSIRWARLLIASSDMMSSSLNKQKI
jgi:hypothetical protein